MNGKTYAFIDASNIIYGAKEEGWFIDLEKLIKYLKKKFQVSKAFFYYGKDSKNIKKELFLNKLKKFGYTLRVKEIKRYENRIKANCDVDLTMDMLLKISEYNRAIVLTGDGDFLPLFQYLKSKDIKRFIGSEHIDFGSLKYLLEFKKRGRP